MPCENNKKIVCPCTGDCPRHGICCACVANHAGKGQFPACFFSPDAEKVLDRSYASLKKDRG